MIHPVDMTPLEEANQSTEASACDTGQSQATILGTGVAEVVQRISGLAIEASAHFRPV